MLIPARLRAVPVAPGEARGESLELGWPWILAGAVAVAIFVGVFGPGVRLGG